MQENYPITGAGENTPSIPYYFSWINNTNEGSTERQTMINLNFFRHADPHLRVGRRKF